ncbi:MAG: ketopantoate reductase family protein [Bacteroidia bacterium]
MKVAILGTGALGCYFAAHLHPVCELHLFGHWEDQKAAIRKAGLRYIALDGKEKTIPVRVSELADFPHYFDLVLVLVKSFQTQHAAKEAEDLINLGKEDTRVLSLQNGLGNSEILEAVLGSVLVLNGSTNQAAQVPEPGLVQNTGEGNTLLPEETPIEILDLFGRAGITVQVEKNMSRILWSKLAINAAINPLTALLRVTNGDLNSSPVTRLLMKQLAQEVKAVAAALKITLIYKDPGEEAIHVAEKTARNRSSMLRDIELGRQTEVAAICGSVIEMGEKTGVDTPLNRSIYRMVKAAEGGMRYGLSDLEKLL